MTRLRAIVLIATSGLLVGCGSTSTDSAEADPTEAASASATASPSTTPAVRRPRPGALSVRGDRVKGEWEDGEVQGTVLRVEQPSLPYAQILYAAQGPTGPAYVAAGVRDGSRILRTIQTLSPSTEEAPDGIDLYGGYVLGERGPDDQVADGKYLLVGSVPGDVEVSVEDDHGRSTPVSARSTKLLPGYTVFYVNAPWEQRWDQVQAAPLTVTTSDGRSVDVRARTWVG